MTQTPTATRLQLGQELQALRLRAGMNTSEAAALLRLKQAGTIRRYERGEVTIPFPHLDLLLRTWDLTTDEERRVLEELRDQSDQPVWWSEYRLTENIGKLLGFESIAEKIRMYEVMFVPGPLQTEDYVRAVLAGIDGPGSDAETIEKKVRLRLERQKRTFMVDDPPELQIVLDESVVRRPIGGPKVMAVQLEWLASMVGPAEMRILPLDASPHPGMTGAFYVFDFEVEARNSAVYIEGPRRNLYLDKTEDVRQASVAFECLWDASLNPADSRRLILSIAEEMRS